MRRGICLLGKGATKPCWRLFGSAQARATYAELSLRKLSPQPPHSNLRMHRPMCNHESVSGWLPVMLDQNQTLLAIQVPGHLRHSAASFVFMAKPIFVETRSSNFSPRVDLRTRSSQPCQHAMSRSVRPSGLVPPENLSHDASCTFMSPTKIVPVVSRPCSRISCSKISMLAISP